MRALIHRVPYRCHSCAWRGWRRSDWIVREEPTSAELRLQDLRADAHNPDHRV
jgi:hypothetical protein